MSQALSIVPPAPLDATAAYNELRKVIGHSHDRYTGMQTFSMYLMTLPLTQMPMPNSRILVFLQEDQTWSAVLMLAFEVQGRLRLPRVESSVYWLINGQRFTTYVVNSDTQTASTSFRLGTDIMPGPLTLWLSAPVTLARSAGCLGIYLSSEVLQALAEAEFAEFRIANHEFKLCGHYKVAPKTTHPVAPYILGLRAMIEQKPNSSESAPLLSILTETEKRRRRRFAIQATILCAIVLGGILLTLFLASRPPSTATAAPNKSAIAASPTPTVTPARRRR